MRKLLIVGAMLAASVGLLYAQEPARFERGIEIIRGNLSVGTGSIVFEGATGDAYEVTLSAGDPTADVTITLPAASSAAFLVSTLTSNSVNVVNSVWGASNALVFEGATADAFELSLAPADVGADRTVTIPDMGAASALLASTLTTNATDVANSLWGASNALVFEGATADAFELTLSPADVAADRTVTIPDMGAASALLASTLTSNTVDAANSVWGASNALVFEGSSADGFELTLAPTNVGADVTLTLPGLGNAAGAIMASTLTSNDVDVANSVWFETASTIVFEGATADGFEAKLTISDPGADGTLTFTIAGQSAGEQLQTDGSGALTWEAAGSRREFKTIDGTITPAEALAAILNTQVYRFHYKKPSEANSRITTTGDYQTQYVGVMADDAPWAMHHNGRILNPVNTFGYTVAAIQALEARIAALEKR